MMAGLEDFDIGGAERIAVPKGADGEPCVAAFQEVTGIEIPGFGDREYRAASQGREFFKLKGADIPGLIRSGIIDLGTAGTDSFESFEGKQDLLCEPIGDAMCRLVLMSQEEDREWVELLLNGNGESLPDGEHAPVFTPLPEMLDEFAEGNELPIRAMELPEGVTVSGSVEIVPRLLNRMGVSLIADRVSTGRTAEANGLVQIMDMTEIRPALLQSAGAVAGMPAEMPGTPSVVEL